MALRFGTAAADVHATRANISMLGLRMLHMCFGRVTEMSGVCCAEQALTNISHRKETFTQSPPPASTPARPLPPGVPMDIDAAKHHAKHGGKLPGACYRCGEPC